MDNSRLTPLNSSELSRNTGYVLDSVIRGVNFLIQRNHRDSAVLLSLERYDELLRHERAAQHQPDAEPVRSQG